MQTQLTELFGLLIYTDKGMFVGEVEDVLIDVDQKKIESIFFWSTSIRTSSTSPTNMPLSVYIRSPNNSVNWVCIAIN